MHNLLVLDLRWHILLILLSIAVGWIVFLLFIIVIHIELIISIICVDECSIEIIPFSSVLVLSRTMFRLDFEIILLRLHFFMLERGHFLFCIVLIVLYKIVLSSFSLFLLWIAVAPVVFEIKIFWTLLNFSINRFQLLYLYFCICSLCWEIF